MNWRGETSSSEKECGCRYAEPMKDWTVYRLTGDTLRQLAES